MRRPLAAGLALAVLLTTGLTACGDDPDDAGPEPTSDPPSSTPAETPGDPTSEPVEEPTGTAPSDLDLAVNEPVEDSLYPDVGEPDVDALHYDLDLTWDPGSDTLTGRETVTFRPTGDADGFQLDLGEPLEVGSVSLDGQEVEFTHDGKDLLVAAPVEADGRYKLSLDYAGTPEQVPAPSSRADLATLGFNIEDDHETYTIQQPWGAFTWYAVNDHPSDKAFYEFTLHAPSPMVGVANGEPTGDEETDGVRTTSYRLDDPAAAYLTTLVFGDYVMTEETSESGVPIATWSERGTAPWPGLAAAPEALAFLEERLGPYPFARADFLVVTDWDGGVETQGLITLGGTEYSTSEETVVHELTHQWWGDQVTPDDWRDLWMSEGMATYLQFLWAAEQAGVPDDDYVAGAASDEAAFRAQYGPPGDYDPQEFAGGSVYYGGALLWHALRLRVGDDAFWEAVQGWPAAQDNRSADRETLLAHLEESTGEQLDDLWDAWLLDAESPPLS